jgi:PTH1 family peptidyl-tRNA hydrolase
MKLVVGLGNPGSEYRGTRHNIGSLAVKEFAARHGGALRRGLFSSSSTARLKDGGTDVLLAVPLAYMNLSGPAVRSLVAKFKIDPAAGLLVVHDELDFDPGTVRLRADGSAGGHNGVKSVIASLGTQGFHRLRIGIGRPRAGQDPADYVLSLFRKSEQQAVGEGVEQAVSAIEMWIAGGIDKTMNHFNR